MVTLALRFGFLAALEPCFGRITLRHYKQPGHRGALYAALHLACNFLLSHKVRECLRGAR
jgi:hypothetical protein